MKYEDALKIINEGEAGFMVCFERKKEGVFFSDYFPDVFAKEKLIETKEEAWELAQKFAVKTKGECINIYVVNRDFVSVDGYTSRILNV